MALPRTPVATYRLQLNPDFGFDDAAAIVSLLRALGVSHVYASPVFAARSGSTHGYDVVDPTRLSPQLGGRPAFERLSRALREQGMGLLLDIVPNHMAASVENPWWADVLEHGPASPFASFFDIDWDAGEGKFILPVLGAPYGEVLERGDLTLVRDERGLAVRYLDTRLPLNPATYDADATLEALAAAPDDAGRHDMVHDLLERQAYQLAFWRTGLRRLNYRRFFDISDLVGLRVEDPEVFAATHAEALRLVEAGEASGLRLDHVDGLRDPTGYIERLRTALPDGAYIVVEKILEGTEPLPSEWPVQGTTGYDFLNLLNGVLVDPDGLARLAEAYAVATGERRAFRDVVVDMKRRSLRALFVRETDEIVARLARLARRSRHARDVDGEALRDVIVAVTARLAVYRTYTRDLTLRPDDRAALDATFADVEANEPGLPKAALDFVRQVLTLDPAVTAAGRAEAALEFVLRWQQLSGPAMAKGLEDTAFYVHHPLLSADEVGGDPAHAALSVAEFHLRAGARSGAWPQTMNSTATHDTKRGEDMRARLNVLSELPEVWARRVARWERMRPAAPTESASTPAPTANERYLIYQTLVGAWPAGEAEVPAFRERVKPYAVKAAREAKMNTSWLDPNERHEAALRSFVDALFDNAAFLSDLAPFRRRIARAGVVNALAQLVVKVAAPGVPDIYQGAELWDLSLADPDNRRPVDYTRRAAMLDAIERARYDDPKHWLSALLDRWGDGAIKLAITARALTARAERPELFRDGAYQPLEVVGERAGHVLAFARRRRGVYALCVVPRLVARLHRDGRMPLGRRLWRTTAVALPPDAPRDWADALSGGAVRATGAGERALLTVGDLFSRIPVALLTGEHATRRER